MPCPLRPRPHPSWHTEMADLLRSHATDSTDPVVSTDPTASTPTTDDLASSPTGSVGATVEPDDVVAAADGAAAEVDVVEEDVVAGEAVEGEAVAAEAGLARRIVVAAVVVGVVLRLVILLSPLGRADADELITGLMAGRFASDGYPAFFWGQHYGGTLEVLPVIVSMRIFGWSVGAMRIPNLLLVAANALLVWRIGRYWLTERQAQLAALLLWLGAPAAMWFGIHAQLFYTPTVTFGLLLGLAAYRVRTVGRVRDFALAGLALGLGAWTSTNIAYFVIPAALVALGGRRPWTRVRELLMGLPVLLATAVVGAWPLIADYLESGGEPMRAAVDFPTTGTYPTRFAYFFTEGLPGALGLRAVFTHDWIAGAFGVFAYLAVLGVIVWSLRRSWPGRRRRTMVGWAAIGLLAYPFVYAAIPFVMADGNLRYTFFAVPFLALVLARVVDTDRAAVIALTLALLVTVVGLHRIYSISEVSDLDYRVGGVGDLSLAVDVLEREGIEAAWGDYWVAYRVTFETQERVIAASSSGMPRYQPYTDHVRASPRPAWVVDAGNQLDHLTDALDDLGVGARVIPAGEFAVVIPDRPVGPMDVPEEARRPT